MKTKEELFKELEEIGIRINEYSEKKYIGENSIGQNFYENEEVWYFKKKKGIKEKYTIDCVTLDHYSIIYSTSRTSEYYKTYQDSYRKMIEFAQGQGEVIEFFDAGEWRTSSGWDFDCWDNDPEHPERVYRIQPERVYRPYTMEDDREHLRGMWIKHNKGGKVERCIAFMNNHILEEFFKNFTFLDGSVIGLEIKLN